MKKFSLFLAIVMLFSLALTACQQNPGAQGSADNGPSEPIVTVSEPAIVLGPGETYQVTYTIDPAGTPVEYLTTNPKVATVDNTGKITAVAAGTATVTVSAGEYSRGYVDVTVAVPASASVPSIQLSSDSLELHPGFEFALSAKVLDGTTVIENISYTWSVEDTSVATVDNGKVTAVAVGNTNLIVSAQANGKEVKAICPISVIEYYEITFAEEFIDAPMGKSFSITPTIKNANGEIVTPAAGELEYFTTIPSAISVKGSKFTVYGIADRDAGVGVRYKGNSATIPAKLFAVTADFFQANMTDFAGERDGITFAGVYFLHDGYQPSFYFTQDGVNRIKEYASERGLNTLRVHIFPEINGVNIIFDMKVAVANKAWTTVDIPLSKLSSTYQFWSTAAGCSDTYLWCELVRSGVSDTTVVATGS